jgi:hypothetical protein
MTGRPGREIYLGESVVRRPGPVGEGQWVERNGERFFRLANHHVMPPFLISVVSGYDHWLFASSRGGLTCGRRSPESALFPYCTDDKLHDACATTGPKTALLVDRGGRTTLWQPLQVGPTVYDIERNLYKNVPGNKLVFEEVNRDLGLVFEYCWSTGDRFGFVRSCRLRNLGSAEVGLSLLDGLRNILPCGVDLTAQAELSTLVDAYKQAEAVPDACAGIYALTSILTDRAEPSEALKATVVWSAGLRNCRLLLSEDQVEAFCAGDTVQPEKSCKGKRGAFFVQAELSLAPGEDRRWHLLADVEQGPSQTAALLQSIRRGVPAAEIESDVTAGTARLLHLAGSADGCQKSADDRVASRHFSNTLFNIMRGGVFPHEYSFPRSDFLEFVSERNALLRDTVERALDTLDVPLTLHSALTLAEDLGDESFSRLVYEYLPLTFSRRHGDPSRPWNHFSIQRRNGSGEEYFYYEGNWRDIFQNWEALALSFPEYIESFIAKFVNASTPDGHNPYRISREGIDWETLESGNSWSNIGYWGDHQVGYLLRLLELSRRHHPARIVELLGREIFVYADVPYRIKPYREIVADPRKTVEYDEGRERAVAERVAGIGADGKLVTAADGSIHRVNLLEKLLISALGRLGNLAPGAGIWMNTQRPEWNDANNALVGYGVSVVTLCYLRGFLVMLRDVLNESSAAEFDVSVELAGLFEGMDAVMLEHARLTEGPIGAAERKSFMDAMGSVVDRFRAAVYEGIEGGRAPLARRHLVEFTSRALAFVDHSIALSRRDDGLFHSYNLIHFAEDGYEVEQLDEMLEGQVAVLSSGHLDGESALTLLEALRDSRLYRADQNSYMLYPNRELPSFLEKNVIPPELVECCDLIGRELEAGRTDYVERDVDGRVHFNGIFRNADELRAALAKAPDVSAEDAGHLCDVYEIVFAHRKFTGRSGTMYKYEGLGCIYWHMVSKLLLATGEAISRAAQDGADAALIDRLGSRFRDILHGLGSHKTPAEYGAFPIDAYSHTPEFIGAQQPGLTGQVKEDVITRFWQLGVRVERGELSFEPILLGRDEFLEEPSTWRYSAGGRELTEELPAGSLAFTLCGVPVIYRAGESGCLHVFCDDGSPVVRQGNRLGPELSESVFRRDGRVRRIVVELPMATLRQSVSERQSR